MDRYQRHESIHKNMRYVYLPFGEIHASMNTGLQRPSLVSPFPGQLNLTRLVGSGSPWAETAFIYPTQAQVFS